MTILALQKSVSGRQDSSYCKAKEYKDKQNLDTVLQARAAFDLKVYLIK